jgi:hypothetical protein
MDWNLLFWFTYIGEKGRIWNKTYGDKSVVLFKTYGGKTSRIKKNQIFQNNLSTHLHKKKTMGFLGPCFITSLNEYNLYSYIFFSPSLT